MRLVDRLLGGAPDPERSGWLGAHAYAHRGLHGPGVPENSLAAFRAAAERGLGIECDVRLSADDRAIVFHDADLKRLTRVPGRVGTRTLAELAVLPLKGTAQTIPTLAEALACIDGRVPLLVEIKVHPSIDPARLCAAVRRDLEGYAGQVAVMSFDARVGRWFAGHAPDIAHGLVVTESGEPGWRGVLRRRLALRRSAAQFVAWDIRDLPSSMAAGQVERGLPLLTWTVRSPAQRRLAAKCGAAPIAEKEGVADRAPRP